MCPPGNPRRGEGDGVYETRRGFTTATRHLRGRMGLSCRPLPLELQLKASRWRVFVWVCVLGWGRCQELEPERHARGPIGTHSLQRLSCCPPPPPFPVSYFHPAPGYHPLPVMLLPRRLLSRRLSVLVLPHLFNLEPLESPRPQPSDRSSFRPYAHSE